MRLTGSLLQPLLHKQLRLLAIGLMRLKNLWTSELAAATPLARRVTGKTVMEPRQKTVARSAGPARLANLCYYLEEGRLWSPCWLQGGSLPTPPPVERRRLKLTKKIHIPWTMILPPPSSGA